MKKLFVITMLIAWVSQAHMAWGQWAVIDASNLVQSTITASNSLRQIAQQAQQLMNEARQIQNQLTQIQQLYTQVQQGVRNLQRFDVNYTQQILDMAGQIDSKLGQAQMLGYQVGAVSRQMTNIYDMTRGVATWEQNNAIRKRWVTATQEAGKVAVQVQAIQAHLSESSRRVAEVTRRMQDTQGNLDTLQALGQGQGLMNQQLLSIEQQLAVQGRLAVLEAQERAAREQAQLVFEQNWIREVSAEHYRGQFRVLHLNPQGR